MASELRVNTINSRTGFGTITVSETGQDLVGITTIENLTTENTLVGAAASFTGNVQIGGVLTYEDVTNIDSVGLITARQGIEIGTRPGVAASISVDGNMIVSGISTFKDILYIADKILHDGDGNTGIRFPAVDTFSVETSGTSRLRVGSGGDISVGSHSTNYADSPLEVRGTNAGGDVAIRVTNNSTTAGSQAGLIFTTTTADYTTAGIAYERGGTADALRFYVGQSSGAGGFDNATERLRISSTGHMGLGVIPSAWPSNADSVGLQIGTGFAAFGRGSGDEDRGGIAVNYYSDGSGNKYIGNGNASRIYMNDGNIDFDYGATNSSGAGAALSLTTHMRIATDGDVAIGHYSPSGRLDVRDASNNGRTLLFLQNDDADNYGQLTIELGKVDREVRFVGGYSNNFMTFYTQDSGASTERMRITDGGNVTIGKTSALGNGGTAGIELHAVSHYSMFVRSSNVPMFVGRNSTTGTVVSYLYNGTERGKVQTDGTVIAYNTSSDYRLKENETTLTNGIEKLKQLKPYTYNFKETPSKIDQGFFAHEVQTVVPGAVSGTKDAVAVEDDSERGIKKGDIDPQQMDYAKLTPLLTAALQEAIAKIEVLESEVSALKSS